MTFKHIQLPAVEYIVRRLSLIQCHLEKQYGILYQSDNFYVEQIIWRFTQHLEGNAK